jgi:hypothetical protein
VSDSKPVDDEPNKEDEDEMVKCGSNSISLDMASSVELKFSWLNVEHIGIKCVLE